MFCTLSTEKHETELLFQLQATATDGHAAIQVMWYYVLRNQKTLIGKNRFVSHV